MSHLETLLALDTELWGAGGLMMVTCLMSLSSITPLHFIIRKLWRDRQSQGGGSAETVKSWSSVLHLNILSHTYLKFKRFQFQLCRRIRKLSQTKGWFYKPLISIFIIHLKITNDLFGLVTFINQQVKPSQRRLSHQFKAEWTIL